MLRPLSLLILLAATIAAHAQGGPPFRTDDPDTPGNKHWEINFGWIADRNAAAAAYQVPDIDANYGLGDRLQLKFEIPLAVEQTLAQPASPGQPATDGSVIAGLGGSNPGIKWRFYEHHPHDPLLKNRFSTGLHDVFRPPPPSDTPEADAPETNFELGTYPQLYLNNPTRSVARGLVPSGPNFYLPIELNGHFGPIRYNADFGYNFGNRNLPQSWNRGLLLGHEFSDRTEAYLELYDYQDANVIHPTRGVGNFATPTSKQRETTLGVGGRQALNHDKTLNLLLMGGRSFQTTDPSNSQPKWIAYVGFQVLFGPHEPITPTKVEQKLPNNSKP